MRTKLVIVDGKYVGLINNESPGFADPENPPKVPGAGDVVELHEALEITPVVLMVRDPMGNTVPTRELLFSCLPFFSRAATLKVRCSSIVDVDATMNESEQRLLKMARDKHLMALRSASAGLIT
jgi:hypothetical protein